MASKNEPRVDAPTITRRRHVLACARCRARRVKCDRAQPSCSNCTKAGSLCQPAQPQSASSPHHLDKRDPASHSRLSKLEDEAGRLSIDFDSNPASGEGSGAPSPEDYNDHRPADIQGRLIASGSSRYFSPYSWVVAAEELQDPETLLGSSYGGTGGHISTAPQTPSGEGGPSPLPDDRMHETLMNVYRRSFDPLVRVLHWPTFSEQCRVYRSRTNASINPSGEVSYQASYFPGTAMSQHGAFGNSALDPALTTVSSYPTGLDSNAEAAFLAILYSVYYVAAICLVDCPVAQDYQGVQACELVATFKKEVANRVMDLNKNTLQSTPFEKLQAMVLYLSGESVSSDIQLSSLQLGAAIRLAQSLGLHRDSSNFNLRPIETELRRRVWAQICVLDVRFAEQLGQEPTLLSGTYDTSLPISIEDKDLAQIDEQDMASRQGRDVKFQSVQEIERSQQLHSPFSPMTFFLVQAEAARLMAHLLSARYRARDSIPHPQSGRLSRSNTSDSRSDKFIFVNRLEHRLRALYGLDNLEPSNPMHFLVSETVGMTMAKARFINRLMEWKENYSNMNMQLRDNETMSVFRDAIGLATRSLTFIHHFSTTPYRWYTKYFKDMFSSSFIAFVLASGQVMDHQHISLGWSAIDQLFPADAPPKSLERPSTDNPFGKLVFRARAIRGARTPVTGMSDFQVPVMHATAGGYTAGPGPWPASMPTAVMGMNTFASSGNFFEDYDTVMQDPIWSGGAAGMDSPYGSWTVQPPSERMVHYPPRHSSNSPGLYRSQSKPPEDSFDVPHTLEPQRHRSSSRPLSTSIVAAENLGRHGSVGLPNSATNSILSSRSVPPTPLEPTRSWPLEGQQLEVRHGRERSISQPQNGHFLDVEPQKLARTKSLTSAPPRAQHGPYQLSNSSEQPPQDYFMHEPIQQSQQNPPFTLRVVAGI